MFITYIETGFEEVAVIRSELDSLHQYLTDVGHPDYVYLKKKFKICHDKCQVAFEKLGEEKRVHVQQIKQFEQQIEELKRRESEVMPKPSQDESE